MKNILIISNNAISKISNNGKTIRSFLKGIPSDNIANLYFGTNEYPDLEICSYYYRITEIDIFTSIFSLNFTTKNTHGELVNCNSNGTPKPTSSVKNRFVKWSKKHGNTLAIFRELLWSFKTWDSAELNNWVINFKPDAIFAVLGNCIFAHKIAYTLSERYSVSLNVYFTDDYFVNDISTNLLQRLHFVKLRKVYKHTLFKADRSFVIGDKLRSEYENVFHRKFGILVNGIDIEKYRQIRPLKHILGEPFIVSFIGGLHLNRWKSIAKVARIANSIAGIRFDFRVYCIKMPDSNVLEEFSKSNVTYCGALSSDEVFEVLKNSHCLIHAESFDEKYRLYTRYSVSTKIPEYMASKRAVIVYGPSEIASIEIFKDNGIGCVLTEKDTEEDIREKLKLLVETYNAIDFSRQFGFVEQHFDQNKMLLNNLFKNSNRKEW